MKVDLAEGCSLKFTNEEREALIDRTICSSFLSECVPSAWSVGGRGFSLPITNWKEVNFVGSGQFAQW